MKLREQRAMDVKFRPSHKIIFEVRQSVQDNIGNDEPTWVLFATAWAEYVSKTRTEYFAAAAVGQENLIKLKIRNNEVLEAMNTYQYRAVIDGAVHDIKSIEDFRDDGEWLMVKVMKK